MHKVLASFSSLKFASYYTQYCVVCMNINDIYNLDSLCFHVYIFFMCIFYVNLITCRNYVYENVNILVHLSVFEFASVGITLVCFTLT